MRDYTKKIADENPPLEVIREELAVFLKSYYNGSFSQMVCDYIHVTGMTQKEVEELLEAMKGVVSYEL